MKNLTEITKSSTQIYKGKMLNAFQDTIILPNGEESTREYVKHIGAVAVVALTDDGKVIIERQFRYPMGTVITEIPAGKLDSTDEDHLLAAKRELREETGITADEWFSLGEYHPASAYCNEKIWMYLARGIHRGDQDLDPDEFLIVEEIPLKELVDMVYDGTITDGKTQVGILKAAHLIESI